MDFKKVALSLVIPCLSSLFFHWIQEVFLEIAFYLYFWCWARSERPLSDTNCERKKITRASICITKIIRCIKQWHLPHSMHCCLQCLTGQYLKPVCLSALEHMVQLSGVALQTEGIEMAQVESLGRLMTACKVIWRVIGRSLRLEKILL